MEIMDFNQSPLEALKILRRTIYDKIWWHFESEIDPFNSKISFLLDVNSRELIFAFPDGGMPRQDKGSPIVASARVDKIPLEIILSNPEETLIEGQKALRFAWPSSITHLQKRQFFRIKPTKENPVFVSFWNKYENNSSLIEGKWEVVPILDLSQGGIGIPLEIEFSKENFQIGKIIKNTNLLINEKIFQVELEVKRIFSYKNEDFSIQVAGCIFKNPKISLVKEIEQYTMKAKNNGDINQTPWI